MEVRRIMGVSPDSGPGSEKRTERFRLPGVLGGAHSEDMSSTLIALVALRRVRLIAMGRFKSVMTTSRSGNTVSYQRIGEICNRAARRAKQRRSGETTKNRVL